MPKFPLLFRPPKTPVFSMRMEKVSGGVIPGVGVFQNDPPDV